MMEERVFKYQSSIKWKWCKLTFRIHGLTFNKKAGLQIQAFQKLEKANQSLTQASGNRVRLQGKKKIM